MFNRRCRRNICSSMENDGDSRNYETMCSSISNNYDTDSSNCGCGYDSDNTFPEYPMYAQSYVPYQYMTSTFIPKIGLKKGTIFPELVDPYCPGDSMEFIEYLKNANSIGKGCNE